MGAFRYTRAQNVQIVKIFTSNEKYFYIRCN